MHMTMPPAKQEATRQTLNVNTLTQIGINKSIMYQQNLILMTTATRPLRGLLHEPSLL